MIVLALGPVADLDFYRTLTRGFGVREYLPQPLTRDEVARHFAPVVLGGSVALPACSAAR